MAHELFSNELLIRIEPHLWARWEGTAEQLQDEGLIPAGLAWPASNAVIAWTVDALSCALWRIKRASKTSPAQWALSQSPTNTQGAGIRPAEQHAAHKEADRAIDAHTIAAERMSHAVRAARADAALADFLRRVAK